MHKKTLILFGLISVLSITILIAAVIQISKYHEKWMNEKQKLSLEKQNEKKLAKSIKSLKNKLTKEQNITKRVNKDRIYYKQQLMRKKAKQLELNHALKRKDKEIRRLSSKVYNHLLPNLILKNYPSVNYSAIFDKQQLLNNNISGVEDYIKSAQQLYKRHQPELSQAWHLPDGDMLKAIFYMNLVAHFWRGAKPHTIGCLLSSTPQNKRYITHYLNSEVGCCDDFAFFLKLLLDAEHIKTQIVVIGPHKFLQSYINQHWYTLDADANLMFEGSWASIVNRPKDRKVVATLFPSPHYVYYGLNHKLYKGTAQLQLRMIMYALSRFNKDKIRYPSIMEFYNQYFPKQKKTLA